jgi:Fe-S-cluster containining protein
MAENLFEMLTGRIDEAFEKYDSFFPIVSHAAYLPLEGILADTAKDISCSRGCSYCCSRIVVCSRIEGLALSDYLYGYSGLDAERLSAAVAEHAVSIADFIDRRSAENDHTAIWFNKNNPCPFLDNNICSVYPARPLSCRTYHSTDDPQGCRQAVRSVGQVQLLLDAEALYQFVLFKIAQRVDSSLAVNGVLTIIIRDILESGAIKKRDQ